MAKKASNRAPNRAANRATSVSPRSRISSSTAPDYSTLSRGRSSSRVYTGTAPNYRSLGKSDSQGRIVSERATDFSSLKEDKSKGKTTGGSKAPKLEPLPEAPAQRRARMDAGRKAASDAAKAAARRVLGKAGGVAGALFYPDEVGKGSDDLSGYNLRKRVAPRGGSPSSSPMSPSNKRAAKPQTGPKKPVLKKEDFIGPTFVDTSSSAKKRKTTSTGVTKNKPASSVRRGTAKTPESERAVKTVKTKGGDYKVYKKDSAKAKSFRSAYAEAKKAGKKVFTWNGKRYSTK